MSALSSAMSSPPSLRYLPRPPVRQLKPQLVAREHVDDRAGVDPVAHLAVAVAAIEALVAELTDNACNLPVTPFIKV